jgi:O-acetylserine/cysteine efflux transporter
MNYQVLLSILFLGTLWGTSVMSTRYLVNMVHPFTFAALRFSGAALLFLLVNLLHIGKQHFPTDRKLWKFGAMMGLIGDAAALVLYATSVSFLSSGVASVLASLFPVMTVLFAHFFLKDERLNVRKGLGVALSLGGVLLMAALGESGLPNVEHANPLGYLLGFAGAALGGLMTVYARREMASYPAFSLTSVRFFTSAVATLLFSGLTVGLDVSRMTTMGYVVLAYASFVFFIGFFLGFIVLQRFGATANALADYVTPIAATIGGALLFGEKVTPGMMAGMALIASGLVLINLAAGRRRRKAQA